MTEQNTATSESRSPIDPGIAEGRSRLVLLGGLVVFAVGHLLGEGVAVRVGVGIVAVAFALNTAGKLLHYRDLPVPVADRLKLSGTWVLLAVTVVALLATYASARYGSSDGGFFWALAAAGLGFGLLHMAAQSKYLPASELPAEK